MSPSIRRLLALTILLSAPVASAETIARWVDAQGITHFGDPQFAPADAGRVEVAPTNGMAVPERVPGRSASGPRWSLISRAPRKLAPMERVSARSGERRNNVYRSVPQTRGAQASRKSVSTFR